MSGAGPLSTQSNFLNRSPQSSRWGSWGPSWTPGWSLWHRGLTTATRIGTMTSWWLAFYFSMTGHHFPPIWMVLSNLTPSFHGSMVQMSIRKTLFFVYFSRLLIRSCTYLKNTTKNIICRYENNTIRLYGNKSNTLIVCDTVFKITFYFWWYAVFKFGKTNGILKNSILILTALQVCQTERFSEQ